ncbi:MAG TPA: ABC transporter permease [Candidatus Sulfotelmatobacter sp.]
MNIFLQDIRYSWRALRRRPGFALLAIFILGLGTGATTIMFTVTSGVLLKPLAYPDSDSLVTVHLQAEKFADRWGFSYPDFLDCRRDCRSFERVAAWTYSGGTVTAPGEPEYVNGRRISADLFSLLRIELLRGRPFEAAEDQFGAAPVAIISTRLWQQRYGADPHAVGKPLLYDGAAYTIVGIAPAGFQLEGDADVFTPLGQNNEPRMRWRAARFLHVFARLRRGVTLAQAQSELAVESQRLAKEYPGEDGGTTLVPHLLQSELVRDVRPTLWLLLGAVGVVLLIGCVNVASLFLTRVISRQHEFALRLALGARRGRLLRQCLTESGALGICGGTLGLVLAVVGTHPFIRFWPDRLPRADEIHVDWRVLLFSITTSVLTGLIFGLIPALRANNNGAIEQTLRSRSRSVAGSARRPLSGFVICQIALALVLLSVAGVLGRTLLRLSSLNPGIDIHNVLAARVAVSPEALSNPAKGRADWQALLDDVKRVPAVKSAALADIVPMREGENVLTYSATATIPSANEAPEALASAVTPDYLKVMRLPLSHGRFFDENDKLANAQVIVVDANLARHAFGDADPVGKLLWVPALGEKPVQVVGVVGHVRHWGLAGDEVSAIQDQFYYPLAQVPDNLVRLFSSVLSIVIRTDVPPLTMVQALQRQAHGTAEDQTLYEVRTMEQLASASLAQQRFLLFIFGMFSGLALLLACVGIYSVVSYLTGQRVPEFGVRIAVGANSADILRLILRESLMVIFAGIAVGVLGSIAMQHVVQRLVPVAQAPLASTFALVLPVLIAVAVFASYIPARRAAKVDPMVALRYE